MKIIFLKDVSGMGRKGDVKDVADGYAVNYLIPRGLGVYATSKNIELAEKSKKEQETKKEINSVLAKKMLDSLAGLRIVLTHKANEKGHLFEKIHESDISKALKEQLNIDISTDSIVFEKVIKEIGAHQVKVSLFGIEKEFEVVVEKGV